MMFLSTLPNVDYWALNKSITIIASLLQVHDYTSENPPPVISHIVIGQILHILTKNTFRKF